jgi:hypothetical protein
MLEKSRPGLSGQRRESGDVTSIKAAVDERLAGSPYHRQPTAFGRNQLDLGRNQPELRASFRQPFGAHGHANMRQVSWAMHPDRTFVSYSERSVSEGGFPIGGQLANSSEMCGMVGASNAEEK